MECSAVVHSQGWRVKVGSLEWLHDLASGILWKLKRAALCLDTLLSASVGLAHVCAVIHAGRNRCFIVLWKMKEIPGHVVQLLLVSNGEEVTS